MDVPAPKPVLFISSKLATDRRTVKAVLEHELLNGRELHRVVFEDADFTRLFGAVALAVDDECKLDQATMSRFGAKVLVAKSAHETGNVAD